MTRSLVFVFLAGCTCAPSAPPDVPAPPPAAPPAPVEVTSAPAPSSTALIEWTFRLPSGTWTGRRLTVDGVVSTAIFDPQSATAQPRWVTLHTLDEQGRRVVDIARRAPELHALPDLLEAARRHDGAVARWRIADPDGDGPLTDRTITVQSPLDSRVPTLEALDAAMLLGGPPAVQTVIRTSAPRAESPVVLPCDVMQTKPMRALAVAMTQRQPLAAGSPVAPDVSLSIETVHPTHVTELEVRSDGALVQRVAGRPDTWFRIRVALFQTSLAAVHWDEVRSACP